MARKPKMESGFHLELSRTPPNSSCFILLQLAEFVGCQVLYTAMTRSIVHMSLSRQLRRSSPSPYSCSSSIHAQLHLQRVTQQKARRLNNSDGLGLLFKLQASEMTVRMSSSLDKGSERRCATSTYQMTTTQTRGMLVWTSRLVMSNWKDVGCSWGFGGSNVKLVHYQVSELRVYHLV